MTKNEVLNEALKGVRETYVTRAREIGASQLAQVVSILEAAGWDFEKCYPYPGGNCSRKAYVQATAKRAFASKFVQRAKCCRSAFEPDMVSLKPDASEIAARDFVAQANASVDAYIAKLAGKIGKPVVKAAATGYLWDGSRLEVECEDGEQQTWTTRCILNVSCLGKLFNQWPTRRH